MALKLTPLDIQQKQFTRKKLGGLDENEVADFLREVAREYEGTYTENKGLRDQVASLKQQMQTYSEMERTLRQTLFEAQRQSEDKRANSEKEAELILRRAELEAERVLEDARQEKRDLDEELRNLKRARRKLKIELKNVLDGFYDMLREELAVDPDAPSALPPRAAAPSPPPEPLELRAPAPRAVPSAAPGIAPAQRKGPAPR
jgi:cell division initiation protein